MATCWLWEGLMVRDNILKVKFYTGFTLMLAAILELSGSHDVTNKSLASSYILMTPDMSSLREKLTIYRLFLV